jgi:hypothetical protein
MSNYGRVVAASIGGLVLLIALGIAAWQLGWFVEEKNVEQRTRIDNTRSGVQDAWRSEAIRTIRDIEVLPESNEAARAALTNQACDLIDKLSGTFADDQILVEFAEENC